MNDIVSVIIPSYKGYDSVCSSVESVINQTYKFIEIIVVDDNGLGSEDQIKTMNSLQGYIDAKQIIYIAHEENKNASVARNTGIKKSTGRYIAFLDDDDCFKPNKIEKSVNALEGTPETVGLVYTAFECIYSNGQKEIINNGHSDNVYIDFLLGKIRIGSSSVLLKREAVLSVDGFDESFRRHQDWEFLTRVLEKYDAVFLDESLLDKVILKRNSPKSPEVFEKNRVHFLNKLSPVFERLEPDIRDKVYDRHYFTIGKEYLKYKNLKKAMEWFSKVSSFGSFSKLFSDYIVTLINKKRS